MVGPMTATETDWRPAERPRRRVGALESHATIGSTNDRARDALAEVRGDGRAVVADEQTGGRGRRGRAWLSPPGVNLMVSVGLRPNLTAADAWQLGLSAALAARAACAASVPSVGLKWPNDLVERAGGLKVGGLLVETALDGERLESAVIGIGINVNWRRADMPDEIAERATSLAEIAGRDLDRVALLGRLLDELDEELVLLEAGASPLERYRAACVTLGARVTVETPDGAVSGLAVGLDATGALLVETDAGPVGLATGEVVRVHGGDR